jgi:hypothetical protein
MKDEHKLIWILFAILGYWKFGNIQSAINAGMVEQFENKFGNKGKK